MTTTGVVPSLRVTWVQTEDGRWRATAPWGQAEGDTPETAYWELMKAYVR